MLLERLVAALEAIAAVAQAGSSIATAVEGAAAAPKRGRPPKATDAPANPEQSAAAAPAASTAPAAQTPDADKPVETVPTLQKVADAIINLANSPDGGRDKAVAILTQHSVKKVPELKVEQYASVLAAVAKAVIPAASAGLV